jgi:16S rRNA (cytidine1402-2'-O)-methyltransferase
VTESGAGILWVVATPIGNLGDMSPRAVDTLRRATRIAAEDTRRTRALCTHFGISGVPLDALHAHSSGGDVARVLEHLVAGADVALVTDAGTPLVSDPGDALVKAAVAAGVRVVAIPGPSAVLCALAASGLAGGGGFRFVGFIARDGSARHQAVGMIAQTPEPVVLFESPERTARTLRDLADAMPERPACVARELTKMYEETIRGTLAELARRGGEYRGEIVIVLGAWSPEAHADAIDDGAIDARIDAELATGAHAKTAAERVAAWSGRPKREIYERVVRRKSAKRGD